MKSFKKFATTPQMAEMTLQRLKQRFGYTAVSSGSTAESAMRSLELVRISVQNAFDKEINELVKKFMEDYFKPAFNNIKENLGQGAVSEDALQKMSCALLENAKSQYKVFRLKTPTSVCGVPPAHVMPEERTMRVAIKRSAPNKPAAVLEIQKRFFGDNVVVAQQSAPLPAIASIKTTTLPQAPAPMLPHKLPTTLNTQTRRQIFWNTAHISTSTKFVLDVQANQAFGFGTDGKERLASKHPELIRYLPDSEDRDWLVEQQIIPQQSHNSRFLFLIHDEVCRLYQTHEVYRNKSNVDLSLMLTFSVPEFMIQKMKIFFVDLNIKSRGLITNSFSVAGSTTAMHGNSHLRNALLLGTPAAAAATVAAATETHSNTVGSLGPSSASSTVTSTEKAPTPAQPLQLKMKSSMLSSSHATLTALLNNSTSPATSNSNSSQIQSDSSSTTTTTTTTTTTQTNLNKLRK